WRGQDRCARRAGWPWRLPARAPTDPDVLAVEHPVPQPTDAPPYRGPEAIQPSYGDRGPSLEGLDRCPWSGLPADASLPSTGSSGARPPASTVRSKRYDFLPPVPPHCVTCAGRYLGVHSFGSLPGGRVRRRGRELVTR